MGLFLKNIWINLVVILQLVKLHINYELKNRLSKISYETNQNTDLLSGLISDLGNTNVSDIIQTKAKTGSHNAILKNLFNSNMLYYLTKLIVNN